MREVAAERERPGAAVLAAARTRSCCCGWPRRRSPRRRCPVPAAARRHRPQLPGGARVPRPPRRRARRAAARRPRCRSRSTPGACARSAARAPRATGCRRATLLDAIEAHRFDACFGGARRDEERARAKERVISLRDDFGRWDPRRQRPELWDLYNARVAPGEHLRVFPLSNWTELDVWQYIAARGARAPVDLLRPRARGVRARRDAATRLATTSSGSTARTPFPAVGPLPHGRRHELHGRGRLDARRRSTRWWPRSPRRGITERGETRADDRRPRPPWRTASVRATSSDGRHCCGSRRPARSTTASRP